MRENALQLAVGPVILPRDGVWMNDERELVSRAKAGDLEAYEQLMRRHQAVAYRSALLITRQAQDAEDATQEGFLKAYRHLQRFRTGKPFRPWLLKIVANESYNALRKRGRGVRASETLESDPLLERAAADALGEVERGEEHQRLKGLLAQLPEHERHVVVCRFFLDLSEGETAALLRIRKGTVKSRQSRALTKLRGELAEAEESWTS